MGYDSLSDALNDLTPEQVSIKLDPNGEEHKITLRVCSDGLSFVFSELVENLTRDGVSGDVLMKICPALKSVNAADLLCSLLSGEEPADILDQLLENIDDLPSSSGTTKTNILDNPKVGDVITSTREIVDVIGSYGSYDTKALRYKDQNGTCQTIFASSWKGFGKNRKVSRERK